jgi:hypothetical protein
MPITFESRTLMFGAILLLDRIYGINTANGIAKNKHATKMLKSISKFPKKQNDKNKANIGMVLV